MGIAKIIRVILPKMVAVDILQPNKSIWARDKAKIIAIKGMRSETGGEETLMLLVKAKQIIPKFKPELYRTTFGIKEKIMLYTPDNINYYPLSTYFKDADFKIKPEPYSHRFMVNSVKSFQDLRWNDETFWKQYMPIIAVVLIMVGLAVYVKSTYTVQKEILEIWKDLHGAAVNAAASVQNVDIPQQPPQP